MNYGARKYLGRTRAGERRWRAHRYTQNPSSGHFECNGDISPTNPLVRVYDHPVFLESDRITALSLAKTVRQPENRRTSFFGAVPKVERHLALHVSRSACGGAVSLGLQRPVLPYLESGKILFRVALSLLLGNAG